MKPNTSCWKGWEGSESKQGDVGSGARQQALPSEVPGLLPEQSPCSPCWPPAAHAVVSQHAPHSSTGAA